MYGKSGRTMRRISPLTLTPLGEKEASLRLISLTNLRVEPRALLRHTQHTRRHVYSTALRVGGMVVYPGWYGRGGVPWGYISLYTQVVYSPGYTYYIPRWCIAQGTPYYIPRWCIAQCTPSVIPGWCIAQCTPPVIPGYMRRIEPSYHALKQGVIPIPAQE